MESKLNIIAESSGISLEEAQMALELAEGDAEQALHFVPYVEKTIIVIHTRFSCGRNPRLYGVARILANGREGLILDLNLALSFNAGDLETSLEADPEAFGTIVQDLAMKTDHGQAYSFKTGFYEHLGASQVNQMFHQIKDGNQAEVKEILHDVVSKVSAGSDKTIDVEVKSYIYTRFKAEQIGLIEADYVPDDGEDVSQLSIYLDTEPVISPVKGKTIDKFMEGEPLPLKITDERDAGRYLGRILSSQSGIAVGRIKDYYLNEQSNRYQVTVEFGPKVMGRFRLDPNVRITTYAETPEEELETKTMSSQTQVNTLLVVSSAILLLFVMLYLFLR